MISFKQLSRLALLAALSITALSANAEGCTLSSSRTDDVSKLMAKHGGWVAANFEKQCEKINRGGAQIQISAEAVVLGGSSIGWAVLTVRDKSLNIGTSDFASNSTMHNSNASQNVANEIMVKAINMALDEWDVDSALKSLDLERKRVRTAFSK